MISISTKRYDRRPSQVLAAYFSMEIGLKASMLTYSGGLGVYAGDLLKAAADLELPIVGVSLLPRQGYFQQSIGNGCQTESYPQWNLEKQGLKKLDKTVTVNLCGDDIKIQAWFYEQKGQTGEKVPILFLDTNVEGNQDWMKNYTKVLYGHDPDYRLAQEALLGIGGLRMLRALGYDNIQKYHMNEGHSAVLAAELLRELGDKDKVREKCVFTTHTPVDAGHDRFNEYHYVRPILGHDLANIALSVGFENNGLNMTKLALELSGYVNAVSKKHAQVAKQQFPGYNIQAITNGVHSLTWTSKPIKELLDKNYSGWSISPDKILSDVNLRYNEIIHAQRQAKRTLFDFISAYYPHLDFDPYVLTLGWGRRIADYKRPDLILSDVARLKSIAKATKRRIQIITAGKAHPNDPESKKIIKCMNDQFEKMGGDVEGLFLPNYNMNLGALMTSGVDFWVNTPRPPWEASGTSGMKALHNGVINWSTLDGWFCESHDEGKTGFSIGGPHDGNLEDRGDDNADREDFFRKLEDIVIPLYYEQPRQRARMMINSINEAGVYNTIRAMKEYWNAYGIDDRFKEA